MFKVFSLTLWLIKIYSTNILNIPDTNKWFKNGVLGLSLHQGIKFRMQIIEMNKLMELLKSEWMMFYLRYPIGHIRMTRGFSLGCGNPLFWDEYDIATTLCLKHSQQRRNIHGNNHLCNMPNLQTTTILDQS